MVDIKNNETGKVETLSDAEFKAQGAKLLQQWEESKKRLDVAKEEEMKFRKEYVAFASDSDREIGTENIQLDNGYKAKVVKKINYDFIKKDDEKTVDKKAIDSALCKIESDGAAGELIAERLIKWTPSLSLSEYKILSPDHKSIIDDVLVTKEASPTLAIVAPKGK